MSIDRANVWAAVVAVAIWSGCGGGGDSGSEQQTSAAKPAPSTTTQAASLEPGDSELGAAAYVKYCSVCHGPDAGGVKGLGKTLVNNEFVQGMSDDEFLEYVNTGRALDDPRNTTGIPMPPKGGNPALTDQETMHIIAHIRTLQ